MRSILRAILAVVLLLGGMGGDWALAGSLPAHDCCCGPVLAGIEDTCPCPKPESSRGSRGACTERQTVAAQGAQRRAEQGQRRTEPRPKPAGWARAAAGTVEAASVPVRGGRDPDLGRHLARLTTLRI